MSKSYWESNQEYNLEQVKQWLKDEAAIGAHYPRIETLVQNGNGKDAVEVMREINSHPLTQSIEELDQEHCTNYGHRGSTPKRGRWQLWRTKK